MKIALSAEVVRNAVCPEGKKKEVLWDKTIPGFVLELRVTGTATYALRYLDAHGRQIQHKIGDTKSLTFDKAKNAAQIIRSRVVLGQDPSEERRKTRSIPTLADFCRDRYIPFIKTSKRSWLSDESLLRTQILPKFGDQYLDKITQQAIADFHHSMKANGYSSGYANRVLVLLKYLFGLCVKWKIPGLEVNPTDDVKLFQVYGRERFLTAGETQRLKEALDHNENKQLKFIVPLLLMTGARLRELLEARWEYVDIPKRSWKIPTSKTGKPRHVPLSNAVLSLLEQLPRWENCPFVVPNPKTRKPYAQIHRSWDHARQAAGLAGVRLHDLRHSMASNMVNHGRSIYEVAKVLGHANISTTQRYAHLAQETLLDAVDAATTGTNWG